MNAIDEAKTMGEVVEAINTAAKRGAVEYFGGSDTRSAEAMAAEWAFETARECDDPATDERVLDALLEQLSEAGAHFKHDSALQKGLKKNNLYVRESEKWGQDGEWGLAENVEQAIADNWSVMEDWHGDADAEQDHQDSFKILSVFEVKNEIETDPRKLTDADLWTDEEVSLEIVPHGYISQDEDECRRRLISMIRTVRSRK